MLIGIYPPTLYAWTRTMGTLWFPELLDFCPHGNRVCLPIRIVSQIHFKNPAKTTRDTALIAKSVPMKSLCFLGGQS